jgi:hypothetical protein
MEAIETSGQFLITRCSKKMWVMDRVSNLTQVIMTKSKQNLAYNLPNCLLHNPTTFQLTTSPPS